MILVLTAVQMKFQHVRNLSKMKITIPFIHAAFFSLSLMCGCSMLHAAAHGTEILRVINKDMTAMVPVSDADYASLRRLQQSVETIRE